MIHRKTGMQHQNKNGRCLLHSLDLASAFVLGTPSTPHQHHSRPCNLFMETVQHRAASPLIVSQNGSDQSAIADLTVDWGAWRSFVKLSFWVRIVVCLACLKPKMAKLSVWWQSPLFSVVAA